MNRKAIPDQNDISNIIGNLPQRLQKKIAEGAGQQPPSAKANSTTFRTALDSSSSSGSRKNGKIAAKKELVEEEEDYSKCGRSSNGQAPTQIDFSLRAKEQIQRQATSKPVNKSDINVLESTSVDVLNERAKTTDDLPDEANNKQEDLTIPGILRLNTAEAVQLLNTHKAAAAVAVTGKRENGRRTPQQYAAQRGIFTGRSKSVSPIQKVPKIVHPTWFGTADLPNMKELKDLHDAMLMFMDENTVLENWQKFCDVRQQLQQIFVHLILHNLKFCCEQKVDTFFWKLLYYKVREYLKNLKTPAAATKHILWLIDEGLSFYATLHSQLSAKYLQNAHKFEVIAKVTAQKLLICLGDLSRYKTKHSDTNDYTEAAIYYKQAQVLIPTNGIPYNQLAIVAILDRKKFDAVYYYMRSLMSSNAIHSARESLLVLFDEIRKKYEETELKMSPAHQHYAANINNNSSKTSSKSLRKEVWIYPDGVRRLHRTKTNNMNNLNKIFVTEENRLNELPSDDLLRRFISLYLYVIGKFYTGIGIEAIQEQQRKLLVHWSVLLKSDNLVITQTRLLKMVALNIFIVEHNMQKESRREKRYYAFNFCNQMFGLMLRKCNQIFAAENGNAISTALGEKQDENKEIELSEKGITELNILLQYIKIYIDWLTMNVHIWEPIRNEEHTFIYCWPELQRLFSYLKRALMHENCNDLMDESSSSLLLYENNFLVGFTPLLNNNINGNNVSRSSKVGTAKQSITINAATTERAQFCVRIKEILKFQKCYKENEKSLKVSSEQEESAFILEDLNSEIQNAFANLQCANNVVVVGDVVDDDSDDNSENIVVNGLHKSHSTTGVKDAQTSQLLKLKNELVAKTNVKKMYHAKLEEILKYVDTNLYVEVRPKYLLPDTNCFIDSLEDFEKLIKDFRRYTLYIPLTVVKELDGLSKGVKLESYEKSLQKHRIHHFDDVSTCAKKSLDYIKTAKNNVKCVTTKGSIINAALFALVEEENVSNDDKILATALSLSKAMSSETSKDGKCFIQTELVLITTDRNLRVKALSRNLAVSELSEFLQWAKDCNA